jgi:hypothetical protein
MNYRRSTSGTLAVLVCLLLSQGTRAQAINEFQNGTADPAVRRSQEPTVGSGSRGNKTVSVVGHGATMSAAREDAIRQAMQETMRQLIVVDRAVNGDKVTRDKVLSTMNGYVEAFEQTDVKQTDTGVDLAANVTVSPTRIENYLGATGSSGGSIAGQSIVADQAREEAARQARAEIFAHLLQGFPSDSMRFTVDRIGANPQDTMSFVVQGTLELTPEYFKAVSSGIVAMSTQQVPMARPDLGGKPGGGVKRYVEEAVYRNMTLSGQDVACIDGGANVGSQSSGACFTLPNANYRSALHLPSSTGVNAFPGLMFALRFLDNSGSSVDNEMIGADCIMSYGYVLDPSKVGPDKYSPAYLPAVLPALERSGTHSNLQFGIYSLHLRVTFVLPLAAVNIAKASKVVVMPVAPLDQNGGSYEIYDTNTQLHHSPPTKFALDFVSDPVTKDKVCGEPLDAAAQRVMLSK